MIKSTEVAQTVTITMNVCDICKEEVIQTSGLSEEDPSYKLQGVVNGDKAYHWRCLENAIKQEGVKS